MRCISRFDLMFVIFLNGITLRVAIFLIFLCFMGCI